jgi:2,3-dimethylmalate lyase
VAAGQERQSAYADLQKHGTGTVPMFNVSEFNELIGFEDVWEFEPRYKETNWDAAPP